MEQDEIVYYKEGGVSVTNTRVIVGTKVYAMANVSSVSATKKPTTVRKIGILIAIIALIAIVLVVMSSLVDSTGINVGGIVIGVILLLVGVVFVVTAKDKYIVRIASNSGEVDILSSKNAVRIRGIFNAVNKAIIQRG